MSIIPQPVTWFSSTKAKVTIGDAQPITSDCIITENNDELRTRVENSSSPILVTIINSGGDKDAEQSIIVECKDRKFHQSPDTYLSQAANALRRLSKEGKEAEGEYYFADDKEKHIMKYEPCVPNEFVSAIRNSGRDYVIIRASEEAQHFLYNGYLDKLLAATCKDLHRSLEDIRNESVLVPAPPGAQKTLNEELKVTSDEILELVKDNPLKGSTPMWCVPSNNKEKKGHVNNMITNGRPSDAIECKLKIPTVPGFPEQPWAEEGPEGGPKRIISAAEFLLKDNKPYLESNDVRALVIAAIENGFHRHTLEDGSKASADHIHQGYVDSEGGYYGLVGSSFTIPEAYIQFAEMFFPPQNTTIGKVLAAFHHVDHANWHADFSPDRKGRFDYAPEVENEEQWKPWDLIAVHAQ